MSLLIQYEFVYKQPAKIVEIAGKTNIAMFKKPGTFTEWKSVKMQEKERPDGTVIFVYSKKLEPREYQYKFIVDGIWRLDNSAPNNGANNTLKVEKFVEMLYQENLKLEEKLRNHVIHIKELICNITRSSNQYYQRKKAKYTIH